MGASFAYAPAAWLLLAAIITGAIAAIRRAGRSPT
jgi:hypothetical protein